MKRVSIGAAVGLAVVVGLTLNAQRAVYADPAIVIKNDGLCGIPGADENGDFTFGGIGMRTTEIENDGKVMLKCKGTGITNDSGQGQTFSGFTCGIFKSNEELVETEDTHATVSAKGVGTMTCTYTK